MTPKSGNSNKLDQPRAGMEERMKRIIDGKRYDTETAENVADIGSRPGTSMTDHGYWDAVLYRTPRGRWFLAGRGGPASMFARSVGNGGSEAGAGIISISESQAQSFLEGAGDMESLERWFTIEDA